MFCGRLGSMRGEASVGVARRRQVGLLTDRIFDVHDSAIETLCSSVRFGIAGDDSLMADMVVGVVFLALM